MTSNHDGDGWRWAALIGIGIVTWKVTPAETRQAITRLITEALDAPPPNPHRRALPPPVERLIRSSPPMLDSPLSPTSEVRPLPISDLKLSLAIATPCVITVAGKRGSGKTLAAMRIMGLLRWGRSCFVVGMPVAARPLLPDWIGMVQTVNELPNGCIAVIDEAYMHFHSMDRGGSKSAERSTFLNLSRQRDQTLIFIAQDTRQLDRYVIHATDVFLIKEMSPVQIQSERPELRTLLEKAQNTISGYVGDRREIAFASAPTEGFDQLVRITTPDFWVKELSNIYGSAAVEAQVANLAAPGSMARAAKELRSQGISYSKIGNALGVSKSTAYNLVNDYPYVE